MLGLRQEALKAPQDNSDRGWAHLELGNILTQSIISGFQSGVSLMMKPLQYFGNAFSERIGDEMADIQSAGGLDIFIDKVNESANKIQDETEKREKLIQLTRSFLPPQLAGQLLQFSKAVNKLLHYILHLHALVFRKGKKSLYLL